MLYVTTRNDRDAYTAQRVLRDRRGPEGGLFVPFRLPVLSRQELEELGALRFNDAMARGLNLLFNTRLTGYDLDLALGRRCVRLEGLSQRILMGECWHNPRWQMDEMVEDVTALISVRGKISPAGDWPAVALRTAILFGIFSQLLSGGTAAPEKRVDIAVVAGDFTGPMAAWYAREMGLPIGNIICCCNENGNLWDFICHGQLRTDGVAKATPVPEGDLVVPPGVERLIYAFGGTRQTRLYLEKLRRGGTYYIEDGMLHAMRRGIYVTVAGSKRILEAIPNVYATHGYLTGPAGALAYLGLQDYRSRTGETGTALVMTEKSPRRDRAVIAGAMGISEIDLDNLLK